MEREIKFRGKCVPDSRYAGEWVFGGYVHPDKVCKKQNEGIIVSYFGGNSTFTCHVIPETVGQFTGVYDKNGKEVYEGDIVDAWSAGHHSTCNVIKYVAPKFFISLINKETGEISDFWHLSPNAFGKDELLEVIGNIHDNPELLK